MTRAGPGRLRLSPAVPFPESSGVGVKSEAKRWSLDFYFGVDSETGRQAAQRHPDDGDRYEVEQHADRKPEARGGCHRLSLDGPFAHARH